MAFVYKIVLFIYRSIFFFIIIYFTSQKRHSNI